MFVLFLFLLPSFFIHVHRHIHNQQYHTFIPITLPSFYIVQKICEFAQEYILVQIHIQQNTYIIIIFFLHPCFAAVVGSDEGSVVGSDEGDVVGSVVGSSKQSHKIKRICTPATQTES